MKVGGTYNVIKEDTEWIIEKDYYYKCIQNKK